jgi:endonuclease/exonuclease/phosphatase family metal-dependent hydrolase
MINRSWLKTVLLTALTLLAGLHLFRIFLPILVWYFGQYVSAYGLAAYALGVFLLTLLAPTIRRMLGGRGALALTVGGLALLRLAVQFTSRPAFELVLATLGIVLFSWFLPLIQQSARNRPGRGESPITAVAFPLAFILDTISRTLLLTYDLAWREALWAKGLVLLGTVLILWLLWDELNNIRPMQPVDEPTFIRVWPLIGLGPFIYIALAIAHNPSALAAGSGLSDANTHLLVNLLAVGGALICAITATTPKYSSLLAGGVGLLLPLANLARLQGWLPSWLAWIIVGLTAWAALGWILNGTARRERLAPASATEEAPTSPSQPPSQWRSTLAVFLGLLVLLVVVFLTQQYDLAQAGTFAALVLGVSGWWAASHGERISAAASRPSMLVLAAAGAAGLLFGGVWSLVKLTDPAPVEVSSASGPLRVMTYNIHQGLDATMQLSLEALAQTIAAENPDIVALNEVNRGRSSNGFIDTLLYLSRALNMPYVFGANSSDGQYGNAVLSRYPIEAWSNTHYDVNTTEVRGLLHARVLTAPNQRLNVFATHLDHIGSANHARTAQTAQALEIMKGQPRSLFLGDLNAVPDTPEMQQIYAAGYIDALEAAGRADAYTFWDAAPSRRIDYIFATPDLDLRDAWTVESRSSDHLPVMGILEP